MDSAGLGDLRQITDQMREALQKFEGLLAAVPAPATGTGLTGATTGLTGLTGATTGLTGATTAVGGVIPTGLTGATPGATSGLLGAPNLQNPASLLNVPRAVVPTAVAEDREDPESPESPDEQTSAPKKRATKKAATAKKPAAKK